MKTINELDNKGFPTYSVPFGIYKERVLELLSHTFATMHSRVFKQYWNNANYSKVKVPYYKIDFESGSFEAYIPTFEAIEENMKFYRIKGVVLPELDREIQKEKSKELKATTSVHPPGSIDSESLIMIAQKTSCKAGRNRKLWARGYRSWSGYMELIIVNRLPESAVKRILMLVHNFIKKRLVSLLESFHLDELAGLYCIKPTVYYQTLRIIVSSISPSLENAFSCLNHFLNFLRFRVSQILKEIGVQNQFMMFQHKKEELKVLVEALSNAPSYLKSCINQEELALVASIFRKM